MVEKFHKLARPAIVLCMMILAGYLATIDYDKIIEVLAALSGIAGTYFGLKGVGKND